MCVQFMVEVLSPCLPMCILEELFYVMQPLDVPRSIHTPLFQLMDHTMDELFAMTLHFFLDWIGALKLKSIPLAFMIDCVWILDYHFISAMLTSQDCGFPHIVGVFNGMFVQYDYLLVACEVFAAMSSNKWWFWSTLFAGGSVSLLLSWMAHLLPCFAHLHAIRLIWILAWSPPQCPPFGYLFLHGFVIHHNEQ
ncbi:hypothetical protein Scep_025115 [Stephania cephalantha]|uniref:Uncharacterized protein n=1 Tax=Stephania cephalantha TaxID=152367 RepID=A0AAP0HR84_9MAGN